MNELKLRGLKNVRDLGGIKTKYGTIKNGKLLRSPVLDTLTLNDIEKLENTYRLRTIIDLRTSREVEERKDLKFPKAQYFHMPVFNESQPGITHEKEANFEEAYANYDFDMPRLYRGVMKEPYLSKIAEIVKTIINLPEDKYAVLFHCTAGKDRTGIIAAMLLLILGADKEVIIKDYMYSNKVGKRRTFNMYWKNRIFKRNRKKAENIRNVFIAKLEYINQVFDVIENDWNGVDFFIENGLKISNEEIISFRKKMLE